jgi:hypothetical protein
MEYLEVYLNDHLAGSTVALEIIDQLSAEATDLSAPLAELKGNIEADRQELLRLMRDLDIRQSRIRRMSGWIAGQLAETKIEIDDQADGQLRRLERLEAIGLGIEGKLRLWEALNAASSVDARLGVLDYEWLIQRARDQWLQVERLRIEAAKSALTLAA